MRWMPRPPNAHGASCQWRQCAEDAYEREIFIGERGGGGARIGRKLDRFGAGGYDAPHDTRFHATDDVGYDPPDHVTAARSRHEGIVQRRSEPSDLDHSLDHR